MAFHSVALALFALASSGVLLAIVLTLRRGAARLDDAAPGRWLLVAAPFVGLFGLVRALQAIIPSLSVGPVFFVRNLFLFVAAVLVFRALLRLPGLDRGARTGAAILAGTGAAPGIILLLGDLWPVLPFSTAIGLLAGSFALVAWRLREAPAAPVVRTLAFVAASLLALQEWVDSLVLLGAIRGDPGLFLWSRLVTDSFLLVSGLLALPAAGDFARHLASRPAPAPTPASS